MSIIKTGFKIVFEVVEIGSIKAWGHTEIDGVKYPPSVKFRSTNIVGKEDKDVGLREIELIVDFQVVTKTLDEAILLTEAIRKFRGENKTISIVADLPEKQGTDKILKVKSTEDLENFIKRNKILLPSKETK